MCIRDSPSRAQEEVAQSLEALGLEVVHEFVIPDGLSVDVALKPLRWRVAVEFEDAANAEEMAAAFGKGEGGLEEAGGLMSRLSFWLANWINEFAADYVSGNQMMTIVMSGAISCFTVAANFALRKIMEVMTSFERHSSLSNFGVSLLHKLSAVYICNYIVVYFFVYSAVSLHGLSDALHSIVVDMLAQLNIDFSSWGWLHDSCADTEGDVSECHASALNEAFADANWYSDTGLLPQMAVSYTHLTLPTKA